MLPTSLLLIVACLAAPLSDVVADFGARPVGLNLQSEEVTENHPDGTVRLRYHVDVDGKRHGLFEQFWLSGQLEIRARYTHGSFDGVYESFREDGTAKIIASYLKGKRNGSWRELTAAGKTSLVATYRRDVLHGKYETYDATGARTLAANYKAGILDGKYVEHFPNRNRTWSGRYKKGFIDGPVTVKDGKKTVSKQKWKAGTLVTLGGEEPFPRSAQELRETLAGILGQGSDVPEPGTEADPQAGNRAAGLRRLRAYRDLCGLPQANMELVPRWNNLCDAAAEACDMNGGLSHTPPKPPGMDKKRYSEAKLGAIASNLAGGGILGSIDQYMDDSDPSNIDRVGHRRWCLNPAMKKTAFGSAKSYSAMWATDSSGTTAKGLKAVLYPPAGWIPTDFFGPNHAWSISVLRGGVPAEDDLDVKIFALDEHWVRSGDPLELNWKSVSDTSTGAGPTLIFRPVGLRAQVGSQYLAEISFDGGKTVEYSYVVAFCDPVNPQ